ncbi:MAG: type I-U CRISPR-associated protein Cas5/Cas6 [bacterium]|nr:type I-U CRISPR-associated protein Cas5/Cas6 [bacterium]
MLAIAFEFPAGRYHATPWGRHVNEADVGWPPDPWRIARALLATWRRKATPDEVPRETLARLIETLSGELPGYALPPAVHAHTRHYMPTREGRAEKTTLVFDAFARFGADTRLVAVWNSLRLDGDEERALDLLLARLSYLGRAESWVEARRLPQWNDPLDTCPAGDGVETAASDSHDLVTLLVPRSPAEYAALRARTLADAKQRRAGKKEMDAIVATLPIDWLASLEVESGALRAAGWSAPPAARAVLYTRPTSALQPAAVPRVRTRRSHTRVRVARYAVYGKPLCRVEDAVRFGERMRRAIMGRCRTILGPESLPEVFSTHGPSGHAHAFYLPEAHEGARPGLAGRVHHAIVFAKAGFDRNAVAVLEGLRRVADADGRAWQVILEAVGDLPAFASPLLRHAQEWRSVTPYLHPWHRKPRFDAPDQIRRELRERGLPDPTAVEPVAEIAVGGRMLRPIHFHRFRSKPGLTQPDRQGSFWTLRFAEPVPGPLALGFACHFGLGLFAPLE